MEVDILGTSWKIEFKSSKDDELICKYDGYCDKTAHLIVVGVGEDVELKNYAEYQRKVLRHEIIHAYLYESGLGENIMHQESGQEEQMVDWIAIQFPKILETFKSAKCI